MSTHTYRSVDAPVDGGRLRVGIWDPLGADPEAHPTGADATEVPTILAVHGITATHQSWIQLPPLLPGVRIVAPDLRGRGRSNALPGPYGMARHADDLAAVLRALGISSVTALGHSMGAFVSLVLAHRHARTVSHLVLVDGGLPLEIPQGADPDELMQAVLGPAATRLAMSFPDRDAYRSFWADHPAFDARLVAELGPYFDYDLEPDGEGWRSSASLEAVTADQRELITGGTVPAALRGLTVRTTFIHAPRGLLDDAPLYRPEYAAAWARRLPSLTMGWATGVNHYTVVMSSPGAQFVAGQLAPAPEGVQ